MKRKLLAMCLVAALAATAVIGGTLAYFTDSDAAENTFTVGNVDIALTEPDWEAKGKAEAETVYPGEPLAKDPTVENVGANPCFVRVSVSNLDQFGEKGNIVYLTDYEEGKLGEGWIDGKDGYFYWTKPLVAGVLRTTSGIRGWLLRPPPCLTRSRCLSAWLAAKKPNRLLLPPRLSRLRAQGPPGLT